MVVPRAFRNWDGLTVSFFNARLIHFFRIFLHPYDITFRLLRESTSYSGYNPRQCFNASLSAKTLEDKTREAEMRIASVVNEDKILVMINRLQTGASDVPCTVFQLFPTNQIRLLSHCRVKAVSRWAFDHLLKECERHQADAVAKFYRQISGEPRAASLQGHLFERRVLDWVPLQPNAAIQYVG